MWQEKSVHPYLDPQRFPLTTQPGLTLEKQKMIDAVNKDDLHQMKEEGIPLDEEQQAIWREFEDKDRLLQGLPPLPSSV